jgi:hypothetical protein
VFGTQTNTYFTVTSDAATVNYDLNGNGKLDPSSDARTYSNEELAIKNVCYSSSAKFNIYFVHGLTCTNGDAAGLTSRPHNTAYVCDPTGITSILNVTAHEVGHLCGIIGHADQATYTDDSGNTVNNAAYIPNPPLDYPNTDRLMYSQTAGGTLLIKPEWDIVNNPQ